MSLLVVNCFHWVGFHIVNTLLENSYEVDGIDSESSKNHDHFHMLFGRNSSFKLVAEDSLSQYDLCIVVGEWTPIQHIKSQFILEMGDHHASGSLNSNHIYIPIPLLFGKWMPMNKEGMYYKNEYISFHSNTFLKEAIYIDDFIEHLLQWIKVITLGDEKLVKEQLKEQKLEKYSELSNNRFVQTNLEAVISHYEQFGPFY